MTLEMVLIAVARMLGSLPVLAWPFWGGLLASLVDLSDLFMMDLLHLGGVHDYQAFDKYLGQVYLLAFLAVALRWRAPERAAAVALYAYRLAGFALFEATDSRHILLFFPNLFEVWFLLIAGLHQFQVRLSLRDRRLWLACAALAALKLFQEYALHQARWLDSFTALEATEAIWHWLTQ